MKFECLTKAKSNNSSDYGDKYIKSRINSDGYLSVKKNFGEDFKDESNVILHVWE